MTAQTDFGNTKTQTFTLEKDSVQISEVSISPVNFAVYHNKKLLASNQYQIDFGNAILYISASKYPTIIVTHTPYPDFLTRTYSGLDRKLIVPNSTNTSQLFRISNRKKKDYIPFKGLNTQGSLARGITIGNNQDAVLNSSLDLQISGKLSKDVTIRASVSDTNIPIQENGYSQKIEEFDRVFIELFTKKWSLKAGDIQVSNHETDFLKFDKKVAGLSVDLNLPTSDSETQIKASGALVRGRFTRQAFKGVEGNQGPYKLQGPNGELFIVVLSGSETIFVNGIALKRGEQNDYTINYNTAEITFTTTYPITATMRITAEFQYSDKNYTRFVTYNKVTHKNKKLEIGGYFYNENDAKNQPLQQNLNQEQKETLAAAGNDTSKMFSSSAFPEAYDEAKILYKKKQIGTLEIFEHSQEPTDALYVVTFSFKGNNQGSYRLQNNSAIGKIFEYIGMNLGGYDPVIQLIAPTKLQVAVANIVYKPSNKTILKSEVAFSNNDKNLFSSLDDEQNKGIASKLGWTQIFTDKKWLIKNSLDFDYLQQNFKSIQRIYNVEFARDWNLQNAMGNQEFIRSELLISNKTDKSITYNFESLKFGDTFKGNRHLLKTAIAVGKTSFIGNSSILKNNSSLENSTFIKANAQLKRNFKNSWIGTSFATEDNQRKDITSQKLNIFSQKFVATDAFLGIGDSTKVHAKFGISLRTNDSVRSGELTKVNSSKSYYIKSKLIQNNRTNLSLYANYRTVNNVFFENNTSLNSRIGYSQKLFKNFVNWATVYETSSGTSPQQEFTYIKTETGQGYYTWIDYNNNQIQEFNEFEVAKFTDQANYLRVALPALKYIKIHQTKLSQSLQLNALQWNENEGIKKFISQFSNHSYLLIDSKKKRNNSGFDLNPFDLNTSSILGLQYNLKNSFFFRRGLQKFSTTYTYSKSKIKSNQGIGFQENNILLKQLQLQHKINFYWLVDIKGSHINTRNTTENYTDRNYEINSKELTPILTYKHTKNSSFSLNYEYKDKIENLSFSKLKVHKLGTAFQYTHSKKGAIIADFNFYKNTFTGNENSPIAYEMLEGLQAGNNYVWNLILQKKLTTYLHLNVNYSGRKSTISNAIHTGNVQLRANF